MTRLLPELLEDLAKTFDVVEILELLDVTSEELLEAFQDKIEQKYDYLTSQLDGEDGSESEI